MSKDSAITNSLFKCSFPDLLDYVKCPVRGNYKKVDLNKFTQELDSYHGYLVSDLIHFYCNRVINTGNCTLNALHNQLNRTYHDSKHILHYRILPDSLLSIHQSMKNIHSVLGQYDIGWYNFPAFADLANDLRIEFDVDIVVSSGKDISFIIVEQKWHRHKDLYLKYIPYLCSFFSYRYFQYYSVKFLLFNTQEGTVVPFDQPYTSLSVNNSIRSMAYAMKNELYYPLPEESKCRICEWRKLCQWKK